MMMMVQNDNIKLLIDETTNLSNATINSFQSTYNDDYQCPANENYQKEQISVKIRSESLANEINTVSVTTAPPKFLNYILR